MTHWILIIINKNTKEALHSIAVSRTVQTCMWISKKNLKKLEINGDQQRIKNPATLMLKLYFLPPFLSKLWGLLFHFFFFFLFGFQEGLLNCLVWVVGLGQTIFRSPFELRLLWFYELKVEMMLLESILLKQSAQILQNVPS